MISEEINKLFRRIELDKSNDSCGFEFADGFGCTFDNIATCYDDRLKLYDLVKQLQQELTDCKERNENAIEKLEALIVFWKKFNPIDNYMQVEQFKGVIEILDKKDKE